MSDLVCSWRPRRSFPAAVRNGMRLCGGCEEVWVVDGLCAECQQIDMDLECRRIAADSVGGGTMVALSRPVQPRVQMGVVAMQRFERPRIGVFALLTACALLWIAFWVLL